MGSRFLINITHRIANSVVNATLIIKIIYIGITHIIKISKQVNRHYLQILLKAFVEEHPAKILHNFRMFLYAQETVPKSETSRRSKEHLGRFETSSGELEDDKIIFDCSLATYSVHKKHLRLGGWAVDKAGIQSVKVFLGSQLLGSAQLEGEREDVGNIYPHYVDSHKSGFDYIGEHIIGKSDISLKITNNLGQWRFISVNIDYLEDHLSINQQYEIYLNKRPSLESLRRKWKRQLKGIKNRPTFSVITPVYNTEPEYLRACIKSVVNQIYPAWQLCIYDDCSTSQKTLEVLRELEKSDSRICIQYGTENKNISLASNAALLMAKGEYVALLDHDDLLTEDALLQIALVLDKGNQFDLLYSDEDKIDSTGQYCEPHFKPDFNLDLLLSNNYICHLAIIRKSFGDRLGWFRAGFEGSQDYDFFLRMVDSSAIVTHIPKVLYHWRKTSGSAAKFYSEKSFAEKASKIALEGYLEKQPIPGIVENGIFLGSFRIKRHILKQELVTIVIPFRDEVSLLKKCVNSIIRKTQYANYEVLLISNNSSKPTTFRYLDSVTKKYPAVRFYEYNVPFNYSAINNWAIQKASGNLILLLNNDTEVIAEGWLSSMVEHIQRPEVGAVGAKLLYQDSTNQHAGVILKINGVAGHAHKYLPDKMPGYFYRANVIQNFSACTAACLLLKKDLFEDVGGLDEEHFPVAFNDVDLCLKIRMRGKLIVYTPYAKLYHYESKTRGFDTDPLQLKRFQKEIGNFQNKWSQLLEKGDPYYNINLSLSSEKFDLNLSGAGV